MAPIAEDTANSSPVEPNVVVDEDAPGAPISVPESGDTGEGGKLKMIIQLVKKCLGVKDIAAMSV
jgi:oxysterol-binding protein-related protein 9/10/11